MKRKLGKLHSLLSQLSQLNEIQKAMAEREACREEQERLAQQALLAKQDEDFRMSGKLEALYCSFFKYRLTYIVIALWATTCNSIFNTAYLHTTPN